MDFKDDVDRILSECGKAETSKKKQYLLYTATLPRWCKDIASQMMSDPVTIDVVKGDGDTNQTNKNIDHYAMCIPFAERQGALVKVINLYAGINGRCIVFCDK